VKVRDEMARNTLWDRFRAIYGPRPAERLAQERWERQWEDFKETHS
jgi:hypothetical protein